MGFVLASRIEDKLVRDATNAAMAKQLVGSSARSSNEKSAASTVTPGEDAKGG
jgi:hypothetical protein